MKYAAVLLVKNEIAGEREPRLYVATKYPEFRSWKKSKQITMAKDAEQPVMVKQDGNTTQRIHWYNMSEKEYNQICGQ